MFFLEKKFLIKKAFTLLEVIIVISVLAIIGVAASGFYVNYSKNVQINIAAQMIAEDLKQMQAKSMSGDSGLKWGIHFTNSSNQYYELFSTPSDYSDGSKVVTLTNYLPIGVSFTDPSSSSSKDIIFSKITGAASTSSVSITSNGINQTISVASIGTVSVGDSYGNVITGVSYNIVATQGSNGTISPSGTTAVNSDSSQTYTITPSTGYRVASLVVDGASVTPVNSYTFSNVSKPHTISATFSIQTYSITASQSSNGIISPSGVTTRNYGDSQTYSITPNTGYYVSALTVDGGAVTPNTTYTFSNIQANHTITATFTIYTYNIVATQGSNGTISPSGTTAVSYGSNQAYTITPNSCYSRSSVTVDGSDIGTPSSYTFSNVQATHTITATYSFNTYMITVTQSSNGTISPSTTTVNCGSDQTFTITPDSNYAITSVVVDGSNVGTPSSYTFSNVQATHTITATFSQICNGWLYNGYCWYAMNSTQRSSSSGISCNAACSGFATGATCVSNTQNGAQDDAVLTHFGYNPADEWYNFGEINNVLQINNSGNCYSRKETGGADLNPLQSSDCSQTRAYWGYICSCSK